MQPGSLCACPLSGPGKAVEVAGTTGITALYSKSLAGRGECIRLFFSSGNDD